jgi:hypothetical protein
MKKLGQILDILVAPTHQYDTVIAEIILVWNGPEDDVPKEIQALYGTESPHFRVVAFKNNSLLNRYHPSLAVVTAAVFYLVSVAHCLCSKCAQQYVLPCLRTTMTLMYRQHCSWVSDMPSGSAIHSRPHTS